MLFSMTGSNKDNISIIKIGCTPLKKSKRSKYICCCFVIPLWKKNIAFLWFCKIIIHKMIFALISTLLCVALVIDCFLKKSKYQFSLKTASSPGPSHGIDVSVCTCVSSRHSQKCVTLCHAAWRDRRPAVHARPCMAQEVRRRAPGIRGPPTRPRHTEFPHRGK